MFILNASSAAMWVKCAGRAKLRASLPKAPTTEKALEGIRLHNEAAECLKKNKDSLNTQVIQPYLDEVRSVMGSDINPKNVEKEVGGKENRGVVDCFYYDKEKETLTVWDFKTGVAPIEAYENWQLINYAVLLTKIHKRISVYELKIVQPQAAYGNKIKKWRTTKRKMQQYGKVLDDAIKKANGPRPRTKVGAHCRYCDAKFNCKAALKSATRLYETLSSPSQQRVDNDDIASVIQMLESAKTNLSRLIQAYTTETIERILKGEVVKGCDVMPAYGRETWTIDPEEVLKRGEELGIDLSATKVVTPAVARKMGVDHEFIKNNSKKRVIKRVLSV